MAIRKASDSGLSGKKYNDASAGTSKIVDVPDAPTISGTPVRIDAGATVAFTAPTTGGIPSNYTVESVPGNATATGSSSPINIQGLTAGTSYTFTVKASSATGTGRKSAASNAITAANATWVLGQTYNSSDTYTVPSGVSALSVFAFGGGAPGAAGNTGGAGGSGAAGVINSVNSGTSYGVSVAAASGTSSFGSELNSTASGNAGTKVAGNGGGNAGANGTPGGAGGNVSVSGITLSYGGGGGGGGNGGVANPSNQWNGFGIFVGGNGGGAGGTPYGAAGGGGGGAFHNNAPQNRGGNPGGTGSTGSARGGGGGGGGNGGYNNQGGSGGTGPGGSGGTGQVIVYEYKVV